MQFMHFSKVQEKQQQQRKNVYMDVYRWQG